MFVGTKLKINNRELVMPGLSLGQLRGGVTDKLAQHDTLINEGKIFESVVLRGEVILLALRRNYPDFNETELFDYLDLNTVKPLWNAVLGMSDLLPGETLAAETNGVVGISNPSIAA